MDAKKPQQEQMFEWCEWRFKGWKKELARIEAERQAKMEKYVLVELLEFSFLFLSHVAVFRFCDSLPGHECFFFLVQDFFWTSNFLRPWNTN